MGRNAWDTTPEEEPEVEESILYVDGIEYARVPVIHVDVEVEVPPENVTENLRRRIVRLQEEQLDQYLYTRELQIRELRKEIKAREASDG